MNHKKLWLSLAAALTLPISHTYALDDPEGDIEHIRVNGDVNVKSGAYVSASQGWVSGETLVERPTLRAGEILEFIPGMMVTQHSGSGKANQYFLRGFNLDHGTDFTVHVDGMPINMRSHGHGQGYSDLNFVIPELIDSLSYFKGTYYANIGDFSSAGGAFFKLKNTLVDNVAMFTIGENGFYRGVALNQFDIEQGNIVSALEYQTYDGPWTDISEDVRKKNANIRYVTPFANGELSVTAMAYDNRWNGADQVPSRAIENGLIDRLGSLDTQVGGTSSRYSLSASFINDNFSASMYAIDSELSLFSNFTYFLDDPVQGDQFEQADDRKIIGGELLTTFPFPITTGSSLTIGGQWRFDIIDNVGLYRTQNLQRISTTREDTIDSRSASLFAQSNIIMSDSLSISLGGRYDHLAVDVASDLPANSGDESDGLFTLKGGLKYLISDNITAFVNIGKGFHSNDARGTTIRVDPVNGEPAARSPLLVKSLGYEAGINFTDSRTFNVSAALWFLELDSELVYVGDAGFTEASRPSERYGAEFSAYYWLNHHVTADIEAAWTHARFSDIVEDEGDHIGGTVPGVVSAGISYYEQSDQLGLSYALRTRYLSSRTVDSDDKVSPPSTFIVNTQVRYSAENWELTLELLNALDSDDHDIDYFYTSRLRDEPDEGVDDLHYHPVEPRTVRLSLSLRY